MSRDTSFIYDVNKAQALIESLSALKTQLSTALEPAKAAIEPFTKVGVVFAEEDSIMEDMAECKKIIEQFEEELNVKVAGLELILITFLPSNV